MIHDTTDLSTIIPCQKCETRPKSLHIAPMLDVSYREFRFLIRLLSRRCVLWTEMVVDETLVHSSNPDVHLAFEEDDTVSVYQKCHDHKNKLPQEEDEVEEEKQVEERDCQRLSLHPIICQIGGIQEHDTAFATRFIEQYKYDEVNLNIDCPSSRVSGKCFGAILMKKVTTAEALIKAMKNTVEKIPISVKTRVGIDEFDTFEHLVGFIQRLVDCGCHKFIIHARKCILGGLSPAQNRIVPPLNYPRVYKLCHEFPDCEFVMNGGIPGLKVAREICYGNDQRSDHIYQHSVIPCKLCNASNGSCTVTLKNVPSNLSGCMLGRAVMENPAMFHDVDRYFYGESSNPSRNRRHVLDQYCQYLENIHPPQCCDEEDSLVEDPMDARIKNKKGQRYCDVCYKFYDGSLTHYSDFVSLQEKHNRTMKISSHIIDRSLKPVLGIFFGLRNSKTFRRVCNTLSRERMIRDCGPGFILRLAMTCMPEELLDQDFVKTEDLEDHHMTVHVAPSNDSHRCCT